MNQDPINVKINRTESLDWLRGLMAISIMLFHLTRWHFHELDASTLLGKLGFYGVSIFFVISGLSMALVYNSFIKDMSTSISFLVRRIFRIWPLLWVCIAAVTLPDFLATGKADWGNVISNMTTAFGFYNPSGYINTGAWSIGNEMVYYALTPLVIMAYSQKVWLGNGLLLISFGMFCTFASTDLASSWSSYVNPLNNLFFYISGVAIYYNLKRNEISNNFINYSILLAAMGIFLFFPISGDRYILITGVYRYIFTFASILLVIGFYKFRQPYWFPKWIAQPLATLGVATYGIYLLHPVIDLYFGDILKKMQLATPLIRTGSTIVLTICLSLLSYYLFESKFIMLGKRLSKHIM